MDLETFIQLFRDIGVNQSIYLWALIYAAKEIRRLYHEQLATKEALIQEQAKITELLKQQLQTAPTRTSSMHQ